MSRHIPHEVTEFEKQGFSGPDGSWYKGDSMDYVRRELFDPRAPIYDFMDRTVVECLVRGHLEGRENRRLLIWSLLTVNQWCRTFLA
jgi:asparagine synthase (glutamine-hydrolysing)